LLPLSCYWAFLSSKDKTDVEYNVALTKASEQFCMLDPSMKVGVEDELSLKPSLDVPGLERIVPKLFSNIAISLGAHRARHQIILADGWENDASPKPQIFAKLPLCGWE
jgi:hypothetical protein